MGRFIFGGAPFQPPDQQTITFNSTNQIQVSGVIAAAVDGTTIILNASNKIAIGLSNPNTWTALQTFGTNISFLGAQMSGTIAANNLLFYNGTNWIGQSLSAGTGISVSGTTITNAGVTSIVAGTGISISGATGTVTVTNTATSANVVEVANVSELELTTTSATTVVTYTPVIAGNYLVTAYIRVVTGTTILLNATWTDVTGAQSAPLLNSNLPAGSFFIPVTTINSTASTPITLTATAGASNSMFISASIIKIT